ncbi:MAG: hypothetical protein IT371_06350 [Deltaproteobacteria bacterium]|nr:hypothetical protein [Deltaproteobacteria bacterium]
MPGAKLRRGRTLFAGCLVFIFACTTPPSEAPPPDARAADSYVAPRGQPTRVDLVVIRPTWGESGSILVLAHRTQLTLEALLNPPDKRPIRDLRFGIVSSSLTPGPGDEAPPPPHIPPNDGTLMLPRSGDGLTPELTAAIGGWPPEKRCLDTAYVAPAYFPAVARYLVTHAPSFETDIEQFLEAGLRALDGRNRHFFRGDGLTVVLFYADWEDCSTADATIWTSDWSWWDKITPNARCYDPPPGLLHPVSRYVEQIPRLLAGRHVILAVVGLFRKPVLVPGPPILPARRAVSDCGKQNVPTVRMKAFLDGVKARALPSIETLHLEPCPTPMDFDKQPFQPLVDRILARVKR